MPGGVVGVFLTKVSARSSDWGFEGLEVLTRAEAIDNIRNALWDMTSDEEKAQAIKIANQNDRLFYGLSWTAPSNSGFSVLIVDARNCRRLLDVGINSEE